MDEFELTITIKRLSENQMNDLFESLTSRDSISITNFFKYKKFMCLNIVGVKEITETKPRKILGTKYSAKIIEV